MSWFDDWVAPLDDSYGLDWGDGLADFSADMGLGGGLQLPEGGLLLDPSMDLGLGLDVPMQTDGALGAFDLGYDDYSPELGLNAPTSGFFSPDFNAGSLYPVLNLSFSTTAPEDSLMTNLTKPLRQAWDKNPWGVILPLGMGALGLYSGIQQNKLQRQAYEDQKKAIKEAQQKQDELDKPIVYTPNVTDNVVNGQPSVLRTLSPYGGNYSRYGRGNDAREHEFVKNKVDFSDVLTGKYAAGGPTPCACQAKGGPLRQLSRGIDGPGGGQDDMVPGALSPGEYVLDADVVAALGDGNTKEGVRKLDDFRKRVRLHKRAAPANKIPPKAKAVDQYMKKGAK